MADNLFSPPKGMETPPPTASFEEFAEWYMKLTDYRLSIGDKAGFIGEEAMIIRALIEEVRRLQAAGGRSLVP